MNGVDRASQAAGDGQLSQALAGAIERGELHVHYQPQLCLDSGRIVGAEALLRWRSPRFGAVGPDRFIPLAEASGAIVEIGAFVMQQACADAARWAAAGHAGLRVSVNVSPIQFERDDVVSLVRGALRAHGLPPAALAVEVTESVLAIGTGSVAGTLGALQADGVEIALDDFGTGYSSLSRLRDLPVDLIKLDRSYVSDVSAAAGSASITRAVVQLAHQLHLRVLAEGVELESELALLAELGCDRAQGWVFSPALDGAAFEAMLRDGQALPAAVTRQHRRQRTLLLVDDEPNILSALRRLFRRDGYQVLTAGSGLEALALLAEHPVDVIVSDQRMPQMSGVEFLRQAKELYPETIRMTLSGYTDLQSIIDAVNEGAVYRFLTKPWDDDRLREHVALAFQQRELAEENARLSRDLSAANTSLSMANRRLALRARDEKAQAQALSGAAGQARDMLDLVPMVVFGMDAEGQLAFVNAMGRQLLPDWASAWGGPVPAGMATLLASLPSPAEGVPHRLAGARWRVWTRLASADAMLLILLPADADEPEPPPAGSPRRSLELT